MNIRPATVNDRDLRPAYTVQCFSGYSDNPRSKYGLNGNWWAGGDHEAGVTWLHAELQRAYLLGHRLIHLRLHQGRLFERQPDGTVKAQTPMPHASWDVESMPQERQLLMRSMLIEFLNGKPDTVVELHIGTELSKTGSLDMSDKRHVDVSSPRDIDHLFTTLGPWVRMNGGKNSGRVGFSFDAASNPVHRDQWTAIMSVLAGNALNVPVRGESLPVSPFGDNFAQHAVELHEWWGLDARAQNLARRFNTTWDRLVCQPHQRLTVALGKAKRGSGYDRLYQEQFNRVEAYMRLGWRVQCIGEGVREEAMRAYGELMKEAA